MQSHSLVMQTPHLLGAAVSNDGALQSSTPTYSSIWLTDLMAFRVSEPSSLLSASSSTT